MCIEDSGGSDRDVLLVQLLHCYVVFGKNLAKHICFHLRLGGRHPPRSGICWISHWTIPQ